MRIIKLLSKVGAVWAFILGSLGAGATILLIDNPVTIKTGWIIILSTFVAVVVYEAVMATYEYNKIAKEGTQFQIRSYYRDQKMCYTDYTPNLRINEVVCIYHNDPTEKMPKRMAYGFVSNFCSQYVEIGIFHFMDGQEKILETICSDSTRINKELYVLPNIYKEDIPTIDSLIKER